ncbi:MAG: protein-L-isoaspartate(D-aspartate) O-methyltransferase [Acidobacteriota bacterium]|nr:protein-L-isoaspartate(D-aspartate) O-methyltransferase [Acidobacteriota bacterium]
MTRAIESKAELRQRMVREQIAARGVRDPRVLEAMERVPRELFLREGLEEFAYQDTPLPIESDQTISQPFIVAYMAQCLELEPEDRVLEIGTGSGYAAAVLAEIASEVYTVERYANLAESATERLWRLGYRNIHVLHGDGSRGWPEHAPYQGIVVAAGGPEVPRSLRQQLAVGGRLVIPVGPTPRAQQLVCVTRLSEDHYREEELLPVGFVPLVGAEGWGEGGERPAREAAETAPAGPEAIPLPQLVARHGEPFGEIAEADLDALLERIGDARLVLLGEASHGTSEFYRLRARITRELVEKKGFTIVAAEADWPDAARIDHYVRDLEHSPPDWIAFTRFPTWMWRNHEFRELVDWLRQHNAEVPRERRVGFYGLDLYSLHTSIGAVLGYLDEVDPEVAAIARRRYGCLTPWESDPSTYGYATLTHSYRSCEQEVVTMLQTLLGQRLRYIPEDGERYLDAVQNAHLIANAERYYRIMYYGGPKSWNLRDSHMMETLERVLEARGPDAKAVVWAHNSHLGDARATEMGVRGEHNLGQLCRQRFGAEVYNVGFGTHQGTVAAASDWGGELEIKQVQPSLERSYERLCHDSGVPRFLLPLRPEGELRRRLMEPLLERAIGVIYRPETELASHYFAAHLPRQFDEYVWFDETQALRPLESHEVAGLPDTYPFGL